VQNLQVNSISTTKIVMPRRAVIDGLRATEAPTLLEDTFGASSGTPEHFSRFSTMDTSLPGEELIKVEIQVDGAIPTTNYTNFWVGNQLLLGTILEERQQKITGYVRHEIEPEVDVKVEMPDGSKRRFHLNVISRQ
jgi:hypothetical protein